MKKLSKEQEKAYMKISYQAQVDIINIPGMDEILQPETIQYVKDGLLSMSDLEAALWDKFE